MNNRTNLWSLSRLKACPLTKRREAGAPISFTHAREKARLEEAQAVEYKARREHVAAWERVAQAIPELSGAKHIKRLVAVPTATSRAPPHSNF